MTGRPHVGDEMQVRALMNVPGETPAIIPEGSIVATNGLSLCQVTVRSDKGAPLASSGVATAGRDCPTRSEAFAGSWRDIDATGVLVMTATDVSLVEHAMRMLEATPATARNMERMGCVLLIVSVSRRPDWLSTSSP
jgi:hypothetical protein